MTTRPQLGAPHLTLVPGFHAAGVACGLKPGGALDMALVAAQEPCTPAAVFTTNRVQAAPVLYDQQVLESGQPVQAVVINSGCANACTGDRGMRDAQQMAAWVGEALGIPAGQVFVMSTGVIGQHLPMAKIADGITAACKSLSPDGGHDAARAIMTTDTRPKEASVQVKVGGQVVTIAGMCKGAGMIHPNMATMLGLLVTDAAIEQAALQCALHYVVERTFNMVTVDGDTSTNDTVLLLANGRAGNRPVAEPTSQDYDAFLAGLLEVATALAQELARDGEGASKFVTIHVTGGSDFAAARQVAKSIANSVLVKTAIYGEDANWGRVLCAAGYSGVAFDPYGVALWMKDAANSLNLVKDGVPFDVNEDVAASILSSDEVTFHLDLGQGQAEATVWTCDLTHAYVDVNAHYRT